MILSFVRRAAVSLAILAFALPASATSTGNDYTDQWWGGQAESGWGVNFIEQGTTIFATLFIYGQDQKPVWYVATMTPTSGTTTFSGLMYSTTGPYFGIGAFDTNQVHATAVGTMTVVFTSAYAGSLNYIVNGVQVNKSIVRQSFKNNDMSGNYMGGLAATASLCGGGVTNGGAFMNGGVVVTQTGQNMSAAVTFYSSAGNGPLTTCTFTGTIVAQGVTGQIQNGAFTCVVAQTGATSNVGTFNLDAMSMTQSGFSGVFAGKDQFCTYNGYFGGVKQPS